MLDNQKLDVAIDHFLSRKFQQFPEIKNATSIDRRSARILKREGMGQLLINHEQNLKSRVEGSGHLPFYRRLLA